MKELKEIPLFSGLTEKQLLLLKEIVHIRQFKEGELLFLEGESPDAFYIVKTGGVDIIRGAPGGKEIILERMKAGDFFGEMAIIEDNKRSATARIAKDVHLFVIEKRLFIKFIKDNPEIVIKMIAELSRRLRIANQDIEDLAFYDVEKRLKRLLLRLADVDAKKGEGIIHNKVTHREMAKYIGTSRETVTRLLHKLKKNKMIKLAGNKIILYSPEKW
ncbi:Crp/Fnr family transcriptional regulator [Halocella sp. SP3-1]|uniref:Crp/Fnr family transcriptional regulator n=1 Tax=Halocella sp. SP3-1 TaxID=2382161 RepID=UPI000F760E74|nr:Crp/Fnr family transcriptional regulator [Halocella sp. SP3-1]AZO93898.1 Crp/Fnr family transcriptional regulator [Halocella sp. SP3-1]